MKRAAFLSLIFAIGLALGAGAAFILLPRWKAATPDKASLERLMRQAWNTRYKHQGDPYGDMARRNACVNLPRNGKADAESKSFDTMAWFATFSEEKTPNPEKEKQRKILDTLVSAGLLQKSVTTINQDNERKPATRYQVTETGWLSTGYDRSAPCFNFGKYSFLQVLEYTQQKVNVEAGIEIYQVKAKSGIASAEDLSPWARNQEVQALFPKISKALEGEIFSARLLRGAGEFVDETTLLRQDNQPLLTKMDSEPLGAPPSQTELETLVRNLHNDKAKDSVDPTAVAMEKAREELYGKSLTNVQHCLYLPGKNSRFRVDNVLTDKENYRVAIFTDKKRASHDKIQAETQPYLETLVNLGVLQKQEEKDMPSTEANEIRRFQAQVYSLMPAFQDLTSRSDRACISMGEGHFDLLELQMGTRSAHAQGRPESNFRYKGKIVFETPSWVTPAMKETWPELSRMLERGKICQGEYSFNLKSRKEDSGSKSCWWAADVS